MEEELLQCHGINQIVKKMDTISSYLQDPSMMLQVANMPQYKIRSGEIEQMRREQRAIIVAEMLQYQTKVNEKFAAHDFATTMHDVNAKVPSFELGAFLSQFALYKGIQQFYLEESITDEGKSKTTGESIAKDQTTGFVGRDERMMKQLRCNHKWLICFFDFTVTKTLHEYFVFKVKGSDSQSDVVDLREFIVS